MAYIRYDRCTDKSYCKKEAEIDAFIQDHRVLLVVNQQEYQSNSYDGHHSFHQKEIIGKWIDLKVGDKKLRMIDL